MSAAAPAGGPTAAHPVLATPAASPDDAQRHFTHRLAVETDPSDVIAAIDAGVGGFVVVDVRSRDAWDQGHLPGAVHCPHAEIPVHGADILSGGETAIVYCWGPGCNGATKAAIQFSRLGLPVKEMIGGFEWWAREGLPVVRADGVHRGPADPLTAVTPADG